MPKSFMFTIGILLGVTFLAPCVFSAPAFAQQQGSLGYQFLKAVRDGDGTKATQLINQNGTVVNHKGERGESALHIVTKNRNIEWMGFLIGRDANVNIQDDSGNTPLMLATMLKYYDGAELLIKYKAKIDLANSKGETPLIRAVQLRDTMMAKILMAAGADPYKKDMIAGLSAHDYAERDGRNSAMLAILDSGKSKVSTEEVYGPKL